MFCKRYSIRMLGEPNRVAECSCALLSLLPLMTNKGGLLFVLTTLLEASCLAGRVVSQGADHGGNTMLSVFVQDGAVGSLNNLHMLLEQA